MSGFPPSPRLRRAPCGRGRSLQSAGEPDRLSVQPGNADAQVRPRTRSRRGPSSRRRCCGSWARRDDQPRDRARRHRPAREGGSHRAGAGPSSHAGGAGEPAVPEVGEGDRRRRPSATGAPNAWRSSPPTASRRDRERDDPTYEVRQAPHCAARACRRARRRASSAMPGSGGSCAIERAQAATATAMTLGACACDVSSYRLRHELAGYHHNVIQRVRVEVV